MKYDGDSTLFQTGGKMATRMAAKVWAETPLGSPSSWPQSLRAIVRVMLTSRYAMWMAWGPDLTFFCNDAYLPTLGVKESWALGTTARKVWEEIWPDIGPRIDHVLATGEATWDQALLLFLERSGFPEETYHTFSYSPLWDDDGQISGMLCVVTEETERVIGERRLATLRDFAAELSRSSSEEEVFTAAGCCLANAQHDFPFTTVYLCSANGTACHLMACSGTTAGSALAPRTIDCGSVEEAWPITRLLDHGESIQVEELTTRFEEAPSGPWPKAPERAIMLPLVQAGQAKPMGLFVAGLNPFLKFDEAYQSFTNLFVGQLTAGLSNARAYEAERKRAEALAEIDRAKTVFFTNISHEFRTPLTLMLGPLLDRLITVIDPNAGPIAGDAGRLQQVIWNLLTNAIKFTPRGGLVKVLLERVNSHLELNVTDTGEGIEPEFLPHVFERFRQADASTTRRHRGLGLGLSIAKQLVELHGGSVRAKSPGKGQGSTFTLTLPLAPTTDPLDTVGPQGRLHPRVEQGAPVLEVRPNLDGITALVVDDDPDAREVIARILRGENALVITASSAAEALERLLASKFALLISDIGMPGEDGYDLIRKVRALPTDFGGRIPAVALTAFARSGDRQRALLTGYQLHVSKPVEPSELITVCASLVGRIGSNS
jgi:CheY-like chemotaxis protein